MSPIPARKVSPTTGPTPRIVRSPHDRIGLRFTADVRVDASELLADAPLDGPQRGARLVRPGREHDLVEPTLALHTAECPDRRVAETLPEQQRPKPLQHPRAQLRQHQSMPAQLPQFANRRRRIINADDTLASQRIRQPSSVQAIRLRRIARFQLRLTGIDDADPSHLANNLIHKAPRRGRRFHRHRALWRTPGTKGLQAVRCPPGICLPTSAHPFPSRHTPGKTLCVNRSRYTDSSPRAVLLSWPGGLGAAHTDATPRSRL